MRLLLLLLLAQIPVDNSPDKTHKATYERTPFTKSGKACGTLMELKNGQWRAVIGTISSQRFDTRVEAAKWIKLYCSEGK